MLGQRYKKMNKTCFCSHIMHRLGKQKKENKKPKTGQYSQYCKKKDIPVVVTVSSKGWSMW